MNNLKKILLLSSSAVLMFASSCKKDKTAFTNSTMKPWFDSYCKSCHGSGGANSGDWKYDPTDYSSSIKSKISDIYRVVYTQKTMPQGTTLTQAELDKFKSWYDSGYPAQ